MAKGRAAVAATRAVTVPAPEDLKHAEKDALLQLRIGRSAHLFTVVVSVLLGLDGIALLYFQPDLTSLQPGDWTGAAYVLLPVVAGSVLAAVGLASKWEEYAIWPWETHFTVSVVAVAANLVLLAVVVLHFMAYGAFAALAIDGWIYIASLGGITLALFGLVLTWKEWTRRKVAAALAAVLPLATGLLLLFPPKGGSSHDALIATGLLISAIFYQASGSLLHLISSGTRTHERELITTGQTRMFRLADDLRDKEEALHFREQALVQREAGAENDEASIERQKAALTDARTQLDQLEEDYRTRSDAVVEREREWAGKSAEYDGQKRALEDRAKELELREQEVARMQPQISTRESRLVAREGELVKREVELTQRQQELERRSASMPETEARLDARRKEIDQRTNELLRREGEVSAREATAPVAGAAVAGGAAELAGREVKLQQLKSALDEQNIALGRRARDNAERATALEALQQSTISKEAELASREAAFRQREASFADEAKATTDRKVQYDAAIADYGARSAAISKSQVEAAQRDADIGRTQKSLTDREAGIAAREAKVTAGLAEVEAREARIREREMELYSDEAEVGLRRTAPGAGGPTAASAASAASAVAVRDLASEPVAPASDTLRSTSVRRIADRLPSGTPRIDDLLLGGLPPRSHTVLVGDAFVGKEVALYGFLAEGLRRGEPIVLVTAARPPAEVTQGLGLVLPQFREFEHSGLVTWIDASGAGKPGPADPHRLTTKGSDDRAGILSALVKAAKAAGGEDSRPFRTGFLGLSAVIAHSDERASFSFLQNVVGILKPRNALAMYTLEPGALSESQVETLLSRMDGAVLFRQDRDKTYLSVKGLGDAQTRDWVECRATPRGLIVGSFALERIR